MATATSHRVAGIRNRLPLQRRLNVNRKIAIAIKTAMIHYRQGDREDALRHFEQDPPNIATGTSSVVQDK